VFIKNRELDNGLWFFEKYKNWLRLKNSKEMAQIASNTNMEDYDSYVLEKYYEDQKNKHEKKILKYNDILTENYDLMSLSCPEGMRIFYPPTMMNEFTTIKFGDKEFSISTEWDKMLKANFGDYMKLPPEEQRICKHNPEVLDFGKDC
jgi:phosphorylcholine metabolism protein LicD